MDDCDDSEPPLIHVSASTSLSESMQQGSWYTFVPALASSMMAPGLREVAANYSITNSSVLSLTLSIFLLSFAIGPLVFAPLSEIYGRSLVSPPHLVRRSVLYVTLTDVPDLSLDPALYEYPVTWVRIGVCVRSRYWVIHCLSILAYVLVCRNPFELHESHSRFIYAMSVGFSGSAPTAIGPGLVGDLFAAHERGSAMSLYALGPLFGKYSHSYHAVHCLVLISNFSPSDRPRRRRIPRAIRLHQIHLHPPRRPLRCRGPRRRPSNARDVRAGDPIPYGQEGGRCTKDERTEEDPDGGEWKYRWVLVEEWSEADRLSDEELE